MTTTIKIHEETKLGLDRLREYKNESYDEVLRKILYIVQKVRKEPKLSKEAIRQIDAARKRMEAGEFVTEEELKKRWGF